MSWTEIAVRIPVALVDTVYAIFEAHCHQGVAVEHDPFPPDSVDETDVVYPSHVTVLGYISNLKETDSPLQQIAQELAQVGADLPKVRQVFEEDWADAWKKHYHTTRIGQRVIIRPVWESYELQANEIEIILDPGMAFGTGTHATTQLCLMALEEHALSGKTVVDLGCGSGILSILAHHLDAEHVLAVDIDPVATAVTQENLILNQVGHGVEVVTGSLAEILAMGATYDVAVVNILARIILLLCEEGMERVVKPNGIAIFSGIIRSQEHAVREALARIGLLTQNVRYQGDWVAIETIRS
ncbi:MAG: 50S ribosomal protein L11 methyltransferase [Phototrophicaceae bacterium]